jgi:hypothetical protein
MKLVVATSEEELEDGADVMSIYDLSKKPPNGYQTAFGEWSAANKEFTKGLPAITNAEGKAHRRGVASAYFSEHVWKTMDEDKRSVYLAAAKEALDAHHLKIGAPCKRSREESEDGEEGKRARAHARKPAVTLASLDVPGLTKFVVGNKVYFQVGSDGPVLRVSKLFKNMSKVTAKKGAAAGKRKVSAYLVFKSEQAKKVALAKQAGEALSAEDQVLWSKLTAEQRAPYEGKAAAKNAENAQAAGSGSAAGASGGGVASTESSDGEEAKEDEEGSDSEEGSDGEEGKEAKEDEEGSDSEEGSDGEEGKEPKAAVTHAPVDDDAVFTADDRVCLTQHTEVITQPAAMD